MESNSFYLVAHLLTVKCVLSWRFLIASMYIILHVLFVVGACAWSLVHKYFLPKTDSASMSVRSRAVKLHVFC